MQHVTTGNAKCTGMTSKGKPCQAWSMDDSRFCFWHDPDREEERQAAQAKGGLARHGRQIGPTGDVREPVEVKDLGALVPLLERELNSVLTLEKSIARARCIGYLAGVSVKILEISDLAARVEALEEKLAGM